MRSIGKLIILAAALSTGSVSARTFSWQPNVSVAFDAGSTGIGFQLESDVNDMLRLRTGFDWVPHFEYPMHFSIQVGEDGDPGYDDEGNSRFDRMAGYLEDMTGFQIDQQVDMTGVPHFHNFKLLIDVAPFRNRNWYFTAGFYIGPSVIGRAYNTTEDMTTLISVSMYNDIWYKEDQIWNHDNTEIEMLYELPYDIAMRIIDAGRMGMHVGDHKDGTPYIMEPDKDNMVKAEMKTNSFKPYLGAGYNSQPSKEKFGFAIDAGILFWGGTPKVYTHEGIEIVNGLDNVIGQVKKYTKVVKPLKVFPVLNLSLIYRL